MSDINRMRKLAGILNESEETPAGEGNKTLFQRSGKGLKASQLEVGKKYLLLMKSTMGDPILEIVEFTGVSDPKVKYGDGGPAYKSVKEVAREYGVKNQRELEDIDSTVPEFEHGNGAYLCVKTYDAEKSGSNLVRADMSEPTDEGCYFYLFKGRWVWGSGAEPIRFENIEIVEQ